MELILFLLPVLLLVLMFSSQRKRQRTIDQLQASLQPGQQIVTTSGLFARIVELDDTVALLEVAPGQRVRWDRRAIGGVVTEGARGWVPESGTVAGPAAAPGTTPVAGAPARPHDAGTAGRPADEN